MLSKTLCYETDNTLIDETNQLYIGQNIRHRLISAIIFNPQIQDWEPVELNK
jgi:hypothetical protein